MTKRGEIKAIEDYLADLGKVAVAYSGGVDSTFLLGTSARVLGVEKVVALTIQSLLTPRWEVDFARTYCRAKGIRHLLLDGAFILNDDVIVSNPPHRCYFCKKRILEVMQTKTPRDHVLVTGTNASDETDVRPGMRAEEEMGVRTPLRELRFTKDMIREYSKADAIPGSERPPAACFATRVPYGEPITAEKVRMIEEAEVYLHHFDFSLVRVRLVFGDTDTACIEVVKEEIRRILDLREEISHQLKTIGFKRVTLDLEGYRMGTFNGSITG